MDNPIIFIYARGGKIKALSLDMATTRGKHLEHHGWVHTHTLDICAWIEYLHNECSETGLMKQMEELIKPPSHI